MKKRIVENSIRKALNETAQTTAPSPEKADALLRGILKECGMDTNLPFTPKPAKTVPVQTTSPILIGTVALTAATAIGAAAMTLGASPEISRVSYEDDMPATEVPVLVEVSHSQSVDEFSLVAPDGKVYSLDEASGAYTFTANQNGEYIITISGGKHTDSETITVSNIDRAAPTVSDWTYDGENLTLTLNDELAGIDYEKIYIMNEAGETVQPVSANEQAGTVVFKNPQDGDVIYLYDKLGNFTTFDVKEVLLGE